MTTDKVAIVTGAAAGIGAACALRLATKGIAIGVLDLDEERCADTLKAIADGGGARWRWLRMSRTASRFGPR